VNAAGQTAAGLCAVAADLASLTPRSMAT